MTSLKEAVSEFLSLKRVAVFGVSREGTAANTVYKKLRGAGYSVFAVNPNATEVEGDPCYPNLSAIPDGVEGAVIATHPDVTVEVARACADAGVSRVWMHRSFGKGSVSEEAVAFCRENGITVIPGGCPLMFCEPVDVGHKCMKWVLGLTGGLPKQIE